MKRPFIAFGLLALLANLTPTRAAGAPGIAYDVVTKVWLNAEVSSLQRANFDADFTAAGRAAVAAREAEKSDTFDWEPLFRAGLAQRRYVAGSKERTDDVASGTATIIDCNVRTMTRLISRNKTYWIRPLDRMLPKTATADAGSKPAAYVPPKIVYVAKTLALGPRQIGPDLTDGYQTDVTMTVTPSAGPGETQRMSLTEYFTKLADGNAQCSMFSDDPVPIGVADVTASAIALITISSSPVWAFANAQYDLLRRAMSGGKVAYAFTSSGPAIPSGRLPALTTFTVCCGYFGSPDGSFTMMIERAHHRSIASDDPIFSIPPDFTKTK